MARQAALQAFLDEAGAALRAVTTGPAAMAAEAVMSRWAVTGDAAGAGPERLPVCAFVAPAMALAEGTPRQGLARAFAGIEGDLVWRRRASAVPTDEAFWNGHANAEILGPAGLERRADLWVGATVMAPGTDYARHSHPPEEVYLSLAPAEWWNAGMDWTDPGPTGFIYNPPGIQHAMRAGAGPFLALWFLPL